LWSAGLLGTRATLARFKALLQQRLSEFEAQIGTLSAEARKIRARWEELKSVTEGFVHAAEEGSFSVDKLKPQAEKPA